MMTAIRLITTTSTLAPGETAPLTTSAGLSGQAFASSMNLFWMAGFQFVLCFFVMK